MRTTRVGVAVRDFSLSAFLLALFLATIGCGGYNSGGGGGGGGIVPYITTQPSNQTVTAGQTATFTVVASGTAPLSYQWQKNGSNITGATSSSYTTPATTTSDNGATFKVVVNNTAGSAKSNAATLTVNPSSGSKFPIKLSTNKRYFVDQNGNPWLMVADAAHHLMPAISQSSVAQYLNDRKNNGFNTINFYGACASNSGTGTCPSTGASNDGLKPFTTGTDNATYDLSTPNDNYWKEVDNVINQANSLGLMVLFEPLPWGVDFGTAMENTTGPVNYVSCGNPITLPCNSNDYNFGVFLGSRYRNSPNIIWQFGQDFRGANLPSAQFMDYQAQVMAGVASVDHNHLITAQMNYYRSYSQQAISIGNNAFNSALNVSFAYTYYETYDYVLQAYNDSHTMPVFLGEANYETANNTGLLNPPNTNAFITRMQMWWTMTSGASGHEFGNEHVNHFDSNWQANLDTAATLQVQYLTSLFNQLQWWTLVPDNPHTVVTTGFGTYSTTNENLYNANYATAASNGTQAVVYTPVTTTLTVDMTKFTKTSINASWYDPTTGAPQAISGSPFPNTGPQMFPTPGAAHADGTHDWVLVLQ